MHLTLSIIADRLEARGPRLLGVGGPGRQLRGVRPLPREEAADPGCAYVVGLGGAPLPPPSPDAPLSLICREADAALVADLPEGWEALVLAVERPEEALALALECFDFYADWLERLQGLALRGGGLQELLDVAAEPLLNPVALLDPALALIAKAGPALPTSRGGSVWEALLDDGRLGMEQVPTIERYRLHEELRARRGPFLAPSASAFSDNENLLTPLYDDDNHFATLASADILHPLTEGQVALMGKIAQILAAYLPGSQQLGVPEDDLAFIATQIMLGARVVDRQAEFELGRRRWAIDDSYRMILLAGSSDCAPLGSRERFLALKLRNIFPDPLILERGEYVVVILDETRDEGLSERRRREMEHLLAGAEALMGASLALESFRALAVGYRQCQACVQLAKGRILADAPEGRPTQRVFCLEDVFCEAMLYSADASLGGPCFCFPAFLSYARRQDDGGLEAATVLSTYLRFGCNTLRTAQHLGMHRNTLSGKIRRIEEGLGCDLDNLTPSQHYLMLTSCLGIRAQHPLSIARKQSLQLDL